MTPPNRQRQSAFTVVELLIAATISIIIVFMLGTMFGSLTSSASHANSRIDAFRDARAALQMMQRDLTCAVAAKPTAYFVINSDTSNSAGSHVRHIYALFSAKNKPPGNPTPLSGDLCAVGYYCGWDGKSYRLLRYYRDSVATFGMLKTPVQNNGYAGIGNLYQLSASDEVIAAYCWNLAVTAYDGSGNVINPQNYTIGTTTGTTTAAPYICDPDATTTNTPPAAFEISFKAMSQVAARTAIAAGASTNVWMAYDQTTSSSSDKQKYDRLIGPHAYQFRTRVTLK